MPRNTHSKPQSQYVERGSRLLNVSDLREALRSETGREKTYWLPYRKESLKAWIWVNNNIHSMGF